MPPDTTGDEVRISLPVGAAPEHTVVLDPSALPDGVPISIPPGTNVLTVTVICAVLLHPGTAVVVPVTV